MADNSTAEGNPPFDRQVRIREVIDRISRNEIAGQAWSLQALCNQYPALLPELRDELLKIQVTLDTRMSHDVPHLARERFGDYEIIEVIGRGGMGVVYKARQVSLERTVALKMIRAGKLATTDHIQRFRAEALSVAQLQHPGIVTLYESGEDNGRHFFSMEYVAGRTLSAAALEHPFSALAAARCMVSIADAVHYAHTQGILHRDLKPSNVLIDVEGRPRVTDFGLAKRMNLVAADLTLTNEVLGTPSYMPPEQADGRPRELGPTADVYSLGAILYALLTGRPPFQAETPFDTLVQVKTLDPVTPRILSPNTPRDLETICLKCLAKEPARRYSTAQALAADLTRFLAGDPILARPVSWSERTWLRIKKRPVVSGLAVAMLVSLLAAAVFAGRGIQLARDVVKTKEDRERTIVTTNRTIGEKERDIKVERTKAQEQEATARRAKEEERFVSYASDIQDIQVAWEQGRIDQVRELLDRYIPATHSPAPDLRGFEWYYWDNRLQNAGQVFKNGGACRCLAVDRQGKYLAAADDEWLSLWNIAAGKREQRWRINFRGITGLVLGRELYHADGSVAFSRDGSLVAAAGVIALPDGRVGSLRVWEVATGHERLAIKEDPTLSGRAIEFSPDGEQILAGGYLGGWKSWNLQTQEPTAQGFSVTRGVDPQPTTALAKDEGSYASIPVKKLSFSDDGGHLFALTGDSSSTSWRWPDATLDRETFFGYGKTSLEGAAGYQHGETPWGFTLSDWKIRLQVREPRRLTDYGARFREVVVNLGAPIGCIAVHNNQLIGGGNDHKLYHWTVNPADAQVQHVRTYRGHDCPITSVAFAADGRHLSADSRGTIRLWPENDAEVINIDTKSLINKVDRIRTETDAVVVMGMKGEVLARIPRQRDEAPSCTWSPLGRFVIVELSKHISLSPPKSQHRRIVWDLEKDRSVTSGNGMITLGPNSSVSVALDGLCFSPDESRMSAATKPGVVGVWSTDSAQLLQSFEIPGRPRLVLSRSGRYLACAGWKNVAVWDVDSAKQILEFQAQEPENYEQPAIQFSDDETRIAVDGSRLTLWDLASGQKVTENFAAIAAAMANQRQDCQRLYRIDQNTLAICCARTLRPLLKLRYQGNPAAIIVPQADPMPGANGYARFDELEKILLKQVKEWKKGNSADPEAIQAQGPNPIETAEASLAKVESTPNGKANPSIEAKPLATAPQSVPSTQDKIAAPGDHTGIFRPGTAWTGSRTYRKGAWKGNTVPYELHVRTRDGEKFTGHVFDNGPGKNRADVAGEIRGLAITWRETPIGGGVVSVEGEIAGNVLNISFTRQRANGTQLTQGDGVLKNKK